MGETENLKPSRRHESFSYCVADAVLKGRATHKQLFIQPEPRAIDLLVEFESEVPSFFGFLRRELEHRSVLFEFYSSTPRGLELRACVAKVTELEVKQAKEARDAKLPAPRPPMLVVVSTGAPRTALRDAQILTREGDGVYRGRLAFGVDIVLLDIKRLNGPGTGGYRVLGKRSYTKSKGIRALVSDPSISQDDKERFKKATMRYDESHGTNFSGRTYASVLTEGLEQGREEGREEARDAILQVARLLLGSRADGLESIDDIKELEAEIKRRHRAERDELSPPM